MMRGRARHPERACPSSEIKASEDVAWVLDGDRGITYAATIPEGSNAHRRRMVAGRLSRQAAGLVRGEGRRGPRPRRSATRSPSTCSAATSPPPSPICDRWNGVRSASISSWCSRPTPSPARRTRIWPPSPSQRLGCARRTRRSCASAAQSFPDRHERAGQGRAGGGQRHRVGQLAMAIRGASAIALVASLLVLAGALAAGHRARLYDAVVLKTLGATRGAAALGLALEYGMLGIATAVFGAAGRHARGLSHPHPGHEARAFRSTCRARYWPPPCAVLVTVGLGLAGTWRILSQKPAQYLRNL